MQGLKKTHDLMENTLCKQHPQLPIERLSFKVTQSFIGDVKSLRFDFYKIILILRTLLLIMTLHSVISKNSFK